MINLNSEIIFKSIKKADIARVASRCYSEAVEFHDQKPTKANRQAIPHVRCIEQAVANIENAQEIAAEIADIAGGVPSPANRIANEVSWFESKTNGAIRKVARRTARHIIFRLWLDDKLILPLTYKMTNSVTLEMRVSEGTELLKFISNYSEEEEDVLDFGSQIEHRVTQHSLSWIYSTDWHVLAQVKLDEVLELWNHLQELHKSPDRKTTPPSVKVLFELLAKNGHLGFSHGELEDAIKGRRETAAHKTWEGRSKISDLPYIRAGQRNFGFFALPEHLVGTAWEFPKVTAAKWNELFERYIDYRVNEKGWESEKGVRKTFHAFADYISYFLPQRCQETGASLPIVAAPKDFKRYPFVDQTGRPIAFESYTDFAKARARTPGGVRVLITHVQSFFDWIAYAFGDEEFSHIAGPQFKNPLNVKFNAPSTKKNNKTNKVPIRKDTFPHLMSYLNAVEKFGCELTRMPKQVLSSIPFRTYNDNYLIKTSDFGPSPSYVYMDETYIIRHVPLRLLVGQRDAQKGINLSTLRMIIVALETGLRFQSVQWLDRYTWDHLNTNNQDDDEIRMLYINTDKTKDEPWTRPIRVRVFDLLKRQVEELERLKAKPRKFKYEGRASSRFDPVTPLFVNASSKVVPDQAYDDAWSEVLVAFAGFAFDNSLNLPPMFSFVKAAGIEGEIDPGKNNRDGFPYCELAIKRISTPHSARSTYVTRRSGATDFVYLAKLLGQKSKEVTIHYDYPEHHELIEALRAGEEVAYNPGAARSASATIKSGPAAIKARSANSALQRSFSNDREETIDRFRMISLSTALSDADETGIDVLRNSPVANIVFRDTHICPVGEECPKDVIAAAGATMRCGVCKLACKSIDHLPAIAAKIRQLTSRIKHNGDLFISIKKSGDRPQDLQEITDRIEADGYELMGWRQAEETLRDMRREDIGGIHTDQPEVIREHLIRVVRESDQAQFLAERLMDAEAYPALITDDLRIKAMRLMRNIRSTQEIEDLDPDAEVKALYGAMKLRMDSLGIPPSQAGKLLSSPTLLQISQSEES